MSNDVTPDEKPKRKLAQSVVTDKRMYFVPEAGRSFEADDAEKAGEKALKAMKKEQDQDA